jgi:hypothetical protein
MGAYSTPSSKGTSPPPRPGRDWEFCFRASEILLHCIIDLPEIRDRRQQHFKRFPLPAASSLEAARFSPEISDHGRSLASRWCSLFDDWVKDPQQHVFADGYSVLFFLCGLHGNLSVVLRGHADASWKVETSLARWRASKGEVATNSARQAAASFIERVSEWAPLKRQYPRGLSDHHREAICQHYGFPTEYLDVTFAYDVALFFAEDWKERHDKSAPALGAIFAVPFHAIAQNSSIVTLPPTVMRPTLQLGKFLRGDSPELLEVLERHKYIYNHADSPIARGLSRTGFETPPRLEHYLYPPSDPLEQIAKEIRTW